MNALIDHAARGGAILGVCNGFQILIESGMLPGFLARNKELKFVCKQTFLSINPNASCELIKSLDSSEKLQIPVAHNEGNFFADPVTLDNIESNGQVVLRYVNDDKKNTGNPNGSLNDIAAICSSNGNILGMMPHPERMIDKYLTGEDGSLFFENLLGNLK